MGEMKRHHRYKRGAGESHFLGQEEDLLFMSPTQRNTGQMVAPASVLSFDLASSYIVTSILQVFLLWIILIYGCGVYTKVRDKPQVIPSVTLLFIFEINSKFQQAPAIHLSPFPTDYQCHRHMRHMPVFLGLCWCWAVGLTSSRLCSKHFTH